MWFGKKKSKTELAVLADAVQGLVKEMKGSKSADSDSDTQKTGVPSPLVRNGLRPHVETPLADIPGGIADRFRLKSQRMSDIALSIDTYGQVTAAPESDQNADSPPDSDTATITIELQSH